GSCVPFPRKKGEISARSYSRARACRPPSVRWAMRCTPSAALTRPPKASVSPIFEQPAVKAAAIPASRLRLFIGPPSVDHVPQLLHRVRKQHQQHMHHQKGRKQPGDDEMDGPGALPPAEYLR